MSIEMTPGLRSTYKQRYEPNDDGLRFQDLVFEGNFVGQEPLRDGILGDKVQKQRAKSKVLEKVSKEDVLVDQFTLDELNDLNNYLAWNIWDVLVMRATEGVSGMMQPMYKVVNEAIRQVRRKKLCAQSSFLT